MSTLSLLCALALASVFVVSGIAKLTDRDGTRQAVAGFGVPESLVGTVATLLAPIELVVALALVVPATTVPGLIGSLLLLSIFTGAVGAAMRAGRQPECHCFGRIGGADISGRTAVRNAVLAAFAVAGLATRDGSPTDLSAGQVAVAIIGGIALATAIVTVEGLAGRTARLRRDRAEELAFEQGMTEDAQRADAPDFTLPDRFGHAVSRDDLLSAEGRPAMLVFLSPGCGPCKVLRPAAIRWFQAYDDRLRIAVIAHGNADTNRDDYAGASGMPVLLDADGAVREAFGIRGTPAAVLVAGDGRLMGPIASGELLVRRLLAAGLSGTEFEPHSHVDDVSGAPAESITSDSVLRPRATVSSVPREQDMILVDDATGASVSLDGIGSIVWSVIDGTSPLGEIIDDLADTFGAPREVVEHDTLELARSLGRAGMFEGIAPETPSEEVESTQHQPATAG